jgi:peptidoglycan/xylan/chitin deacetylase (PgdA/CDA1 family)
VGTYFVTGRLALENTSGAIVTQDDLIEMVSRGHEIGCHTYSHQSVMGRNANDLANDLDLNATRLREAANLEGLFTFAYPYGQVSWTAKRVCGARFAACRGVREGMNYRFVDLSELRASRIFHPTYSPRHISELVKKCKRRGAWLIFYTHDVTERPSEWGCTPQEFTSVVQEVVNAGIEILSIKAAVGKSMFRT